MNNLEKWFGLNSIQNKKVKDYLASYQEGMFRYFDTGETSTLEELLESSEKKCEAKGDLMLIEWFKKTGIQEIKKLAEKTVRDDSHLEPKVEYSQYILQEELEGIYCREDLRSCLMSIFD